MQKKEQYSQNKEVISQVRAKHYIENKKVILEAKAHHYSIHKKVINERRKNKKTEERIKAFKRDIIHGPNYSCFSCKRILYKNSVKILKISEIKTLLEKLNENFLKKVDLYCFKEDSLIFCHNCFKLIKSSKVPRIHVSNGLKLDKVPEELKLRDLEQQLIARSLIFMKVKKLPGYNRMKAMVDQVISVPIEEDVVSKTISALPRHPDDAKIVAVQLKRKLEMKNTHLSEYIRPEKCIKAVEKLKELGNPFYKNIKVNDKFMDIEEDDSDMDELLDEIMDDFEIQQESKDQPKEPEEENIDEDDGILDAVKKYQSRHQNHTCLMPQDMADQVVVNSEMKPVTIAKEGSNETFKFAPGEGGIANNMMGMRGEHVDVRAFPRHHPSGHFGLHHQREIKLTPSQYFNQRLMNEDERFSKDSFYVFTAAAYVERHGIERQIDISGVKGQGDKLENGEVKVNLKDMFSVFKKIKGTPKYWQTARNELIAKVKQLGPFHLFYTFSCAEMRWSEVFVSLLMRKGYKVEIPDKWDGNDNTLMVEGKELWDYVNEDMAQSYHDLFLDYTFLISRLFDARVKSFIKNILLGRGEGKVAIANYSYRVEFQARGLPHIHGVCWIEKKELIHRQIFGDLMDNEEEALKLADELISCALPEDEPELRTIVSQVQKHKHTPSCLKYDGVCRYGFPKLPSPRTVLSKPLDPEMEEKERNEKKAKASKILGKAKKLLNDLEAKKLLNDPSLDENMTLEEFYASIGTTEDEYVEALQISERGKVLVLKRKINERMINNYSPEMLLAWNANMDIQLVVDPYAVISYIASYMNKTDTETTPFLRETLHATAGKETKEKLRALKEAYIGHRQCGASEAAYKVNPSLRMKDSNIATVFVTTGFPKNRSIFYRRIKDEEENSVDHEVETEDFENDEPDEEYEDYEDFQPPPSKKVKIEGRPGTYSESITVIERYVARPEHLEDMCLGQFAISYVYASKVPKKIIFDDDGPYDGCSTEFSDQKIFEEETETDEYTELYKQEAERERAESTDVLEEESNTFEEMDIANGDETQNLHHLLPKYISLKDGLGLMRLRGQPAVMRIHSSKKKVNHEQQYSELLLYTNWRDEINEFHPDNGEDCIKEYNERIDIIKRNKEAIYPGEGTIDLLENMDLDQRPVHIYDMLDSERQQQEADDLMAGAENDPQFESFAYTGNLVQDGAQGGNGLCESSKYRIVNVPKEDELSHRTRRLVPEQMNILRRVCSYCRDVVKSRKNISHKVNPLKLIVHGGAGKYFFY